MTATRFYIDENYYIIPSAVLLRGVPICKYDSYVSRFIPSWFDPFYNGNKKILIDHRKSNETTGIQISFSI